MADAAIKQLVLAGKAPAKCDVVILGITFKENCPDCRNSKVGDVINRLKEYGINPSVVDDWANPEEAKRSYGVEIVPLHSIDHADCVIVAVAHDDFKTLDIQMLSSLYASRKDKILVDVKGLYDRNELARHGFKVWRL